MEKETSQIMNIYDSILSFHGTWRTYQALVLETRIHAVLRRTANPQDSRHSLLICGDIQMDCEKFLQAHYNKCK